MCKYHQPLSYATGMCMLWFVTKKDFRLALRRCHWNVYRFTKIQHCTDYLSGWLGTVTGVQSSVISTLSHRHYKWQSPEHAPGHAGTNEAVSSVSRWEMRNEWLCRQSQIPIKCQSLPTGRLSLSVCVNKTRWDWKMLISRRDSDVHFMIDGQQADADIDCWKRCRRNFCPPIIFWSCTTGPSVHLNLPTGRNRRMVLPWRWLLSIIST